MSSAILPMPPYPWQQEVWSNFAERMLSGRLPHAILLSGQEGVGLESLGKAMGQLLLCLSPLQGLCCGSCRGCQLLSSSTHPDLFCVFPEDEGKPIKVDQVRALSSFVSKTAQQGGYKVILLAPAEAMNLNAANALLKNLEEPSGKTVFVLISQQPSRLLPTIRSRCLKVDMPLPPTAMSLEWLKAAGIEESQGLLDEAYGAPLLAKRWHDEGVLSERKDVIKALVDILQYQLEPMVCAKKWSSKDPLQILDVMQDAIDIVVAKTLANAAIPANYSSLVKAMEGCSDRLLFKLRDRLCEKKRQLLGPSNLNGHLAVEELVLDWYAVTRIKSPRY